MASIKDIYQEARDNNIISQDFTEEQFDKVMRDDNMRRKFHEMASQSFPNFYPADYDKFAGTINKIMNPVAANPAPTNATEDSINLAKQSEGEKEYNISTPQLGTASTPAWDLVGQAEQQLAQPQVAEKPTEVEQAQPTAHVEENTDEEKGWGGRANEALNRADEKLDNKNWFVRGLGEFGLGVVDWLKSPTVGAVGGITEHVVQGTMNQLAIGAGNTIKVDAMGQPMYTEGISYDDQVKAAKRVEEARKKGEEPRKIDLLNSSLVRGARSVGEFADNMNALARPYDLSENDTFTSLMAEGRVGDAMQLGLAGSGQSATYSLMMRNPYTAAWALSLSAANEYADLTWDNPEMSKGRRAAHAAGRAGIEMLVERFADEFKFLDGASQEVVGRTFKEMYQQAGWSVLRRLGIETAKSAAKEGGEEVLTTFGTDVFDTLVDIGSQDGVGLKQQYEEFKKQMQAANPDIKLDDKTLGWAFAENKGIELLNSFFGGFFSGGFTTGGTLAGMQLVNGDLTSQKAQDEMMKQAINEVAAEDGVSAQDVYNAADREVKDPSQGTAIRDKVQAKYQGIVSNVITNEAVRQLQPITNRTNNYIYQVDFDSNELNEGDEAYIIDGNVVVNEDGYDVILDHTSSDETVYVRIRRADGTEQVKQVPVRELNLVQRPATAQEWASTFAESVLTGMMQQPQQSQQVEGEEASSQTSAQNEQASNIEGRQFTNGQQTITASPADSNGNVRLSSTITLADGSAVEVVPQDMVGGLLAENGWQEVTPQPQGQVQGQAQGQQQAPVFWAEMTAEQAIAESVTRNNGNKQRAKQFAERQIAVKKQALKDAEMVMRNIPADDLDAFNAAQDKVDAAQAEVDKWTAVANGVESYVAPQADVQEQPVAQDQPPVQVEPIAQVEPTPQPAPQAVEGKETGSNEMPKETEDKPKKITRESVSNLLSKEAKELEAEFEYEIKDADATEVAHDIFWLIGSAADGWMEEEIMDYVGEHYPTQANISGETNSEQGKKEREQLKKDKKLKELESEIKNKQAELESLVNEIRGLMQSVATSDNATAQDIAKLMESVANYKRNMVYTHERSGEMGNYDILDKYIGTTKALLRDVQKQYKQMTALANASPKVKDVIGLADKQSEVLADKEKFEEAYKKKESALNDLTLEEMEELMDVLRSTGKNDLLYQDVENRVASIKKSQRIQKEAKSLDEIFDNGGTQVDRPAKMKPYKHNPFDFTANDPMRPTMSTAYHEDGHVVSTDAHILVAVKQGYDKKLEGKMTDKKGNVVHEGMKFPNWKLVLDNARKNKVGKTTINVEDLRSFLEGAKAKLKEEWKAKKDSGERVGSFNDYLYNYVNIMLRTKEGVHTYRLGRMIYFANALSVIEAKEVHFDGRQTVDAQAMYAETAQGKAVLMPVLVEKIDIKEDGTVVTDGTRTAVLYDLANQSGNDLSKFAKKLGAKGVHVVSDESQLPKSEDAAYRAIKRGVKVMGWWNPANNQVYIYTPNATSVEEVKSALLHEFVSHRGLREMLGKEEFDNLCRKVWDMMSDKDKLQYAAYVKYQIAVNSSNMNNLLAKMSEKEKQDLLNSEYYQLAAADEYMAHIADTGVSETERTIWQKICDWVRAALRKVGIDVQITDADIANLLRASSKRLSTDGSMTEIANTIYENKDKFQDKVDIDSNGESQVRYSIVTDKKKIEELENSEKVIGYRNVVLDEDGTFGSPMASSLQGEGKKVKTQGFELNKWEQAEENPDLADENGKIDLVKPDGKSIRKVDYNPYIHNRPNKVNKQFKQAWERPNLVYIETEIAKTDLDEGYHAPKAKKSVGVHKWNGGKLILSRYDKPIRIVPWEEVADDWVKAFKNRGVEFDIVPPALLPILHERGVEILPPHKNMGEECNAAYAQWRAENSNPRFSISSIAEDAWTKYQYDGELKTIRDVIDYVEENMPDNDQTKSLFDAIETYKEEEFEDRQYYGMRGDLEPFADAILEELEILMNSKPRFSITEGTQVVNLGDNTLVGLHNISQSKIRKAIKQGGLANPSAAVIDIAKQNHEGYGEITLVMPSKLVESETGRNAGTYTGDAWSPTYPYVELQLTDKGRDKYYDTLREVFKNENVGIKNRMALVFENMLDNQGNPEMLAYWYLLEKGIEPTKVIFNSGISDSVKERFATLREKGSVGNLNAEERELLIELAAEIEGKTKEDLLQEAQDRIKFLNIAANSNDGFRRRVALATLEDIEEYGVSSRVLSDAFYKIDRAMIEDGKLDVERTVSNARNYVEEQGMLEDLNSWIENLRDRFIIKEVIFDGYDRNGNRKYVPNTLSNASRLMNRESEQNAYSNTGLSATRAMLIERLKTLEDIRNNKHRLVAQSEQEQEEWDQMQDKWFNDIIEPLSKMQKVDSNPFINNDIAARRLIEAVTKPNPIAYLNREYKYTIPLNGTYAKTLNEMIKQLKEMPTKYFETKFKRPVYLNEFSAAVVPQGLAEDIKAALQGFGMPLFEYNEKVDGSRREATLKATEIEGVRFSIIGERGAANLDRAEEATTRLDNLAVAREMESANKDAKTIKMATGWERGADGKWRYEVDDIKLKNNPEIQNNGYYNFIDLKDLLDDSALLESYPRGSFAQIDEQTGEPYGMVNMSLGDIRVFFDRFTRNASYEESGKNIWMPDFYRSFIGTNKEDLLRVVLSHEIQHAIQDAEGFAVGADINEGNYERYAGEVEARNVESRLGMSAEERRETLLSETEDVAREDQLFIFDAIGNANEDIRFSVSNTNQRIFVSNAERAVESIKQEKATPQQWKAMIEKQGGLKAGEDKWLGLSEWLDSKVAPAQENETLGDVARRVARNTITKDEILEFIRANKVQIEEVEYGSDGLAAMQEEFDGILAHNGWDADDAFEQMVERYGDDFGMAMTHYDGILEFAEGFEDYSEQFASSRAINSTRLGYTTKGLENKREIALVVPTIESWNEGDNIHFGDAGEGRAIAWVRFGETKVISKPKELEQAEKEYSDFSRRMIRLYGLTYSERIMSDSEIKEQEELLSKLRQAQTEHPKVESKVLVIDEIQSKRHQEGREKGYKGSFDKAALEQAQKESKEYGDYLYEKYIKGKRKGEDFLDYATEEEKAKFHELSDKVAEINKLRYHGIPDAPFEKNWHELAFKRMLRYAAENGYDKVAWTTGEQQAQRYNLGDIVDKIRTSEDFLDGTIKVDIDAKNTRGWTLYVTEDGMITNRGAHAQANNWAGKPLSDVVGKPMAEKILSNKNQTIEGEGLSVGGEGMKGFYDKMLPSFVSKYVKKWGAKVGEVTMPQLEEGYQTMHSVDVTEEMKESVMQGQPMFSIRNRTEDLRMSQESSTFAEQYRWGDALLDEDYISEEYTKEMDAFYEGMIDAELATSKEERIDAYESKAKAALDFLKKLDNSGQKVYAISSYENMAKDLEGAGLSKDIAEVVIKNEDKLRAKNKRSSGVKYEDKVFIFTENIDSLVEVLLTYAHEVQHIENERNRQLLADIIDISSPQELDGILKAIGRDYSDALNNAEDGFIELADEVVAYMMEYGYKLGSNGNLAEALKRDGMQNEELINLLQQEYERRKRSTPFVLNKNQRVNAIRSSQRVRDKKDGRNLQGRSQQVGFPQFDRFAIRSNRLTRGGIVRNIAEQQRLQRLRDDAVSKLLSTTEVYAEDIVLEDDFDLTPRFSISNAPTPIPNETKGEYTRRFIEWRDSQVDATAKREVVQAMKKADGIIGRLAKKFVDRSKPIDDFQKEIVRQGGKLDVSNNAYADVTMAIGRAGFQVRKYSNIQMRAMLDAIREMMDSKLLDGIELTWANMDTEYTDPKERIDGKRLTVRELIGVYCQAMDVQEAKQKDLPDRGEAGFKKNLRDAKGNEVSYEDVIRMVHDAVTGTILTKKLWDAINDATKFALRYQLASGMIDQETFDKFNDRDYYVPERGWRERDMDGREDKYQESQGMTNGSPYNAALTKAHGRESLASDPFAYIQSIAETTIMSAEKNKVKQKFLKFVLDNENIGFKTAAWNVRRVWLMDDGNGGVVATFVKPEDDSKIVRGFANDKQIEEAKNKFIQLSSNVDQRTRAERLQHQVVVMRDGIQYVVELENEELANTINGKYEGMNDLWEEWGNVQRSMVNYMSAINTQYNPVFPIFNLVRDLQLALISNIGEQDAKFTANFIKNIGKVQGAIWKYVSNEKIMGREVFAATQMGKYLEEYFEQGAQTGFSFLRDIEALNKDIDKELAKGKAANAWKKGKDVALGTLSMFTEVSELTVRVAQYVTARESGYSAEEAAQMAKEISVNFDRKGTESRALSKLYSFFNASIQGTNKIWRMVKSKRARRALLGASALYMALGILNTLMNPDDPEEDVWASDYTRKTNFLFGKVRIPVAHFFRIFYAAGVDIVRCAQGRKTIKQAIFDTSTFTADELVPSSIFQVHNLWEYNEVLNEVEFNPAQYVQGAAPSWISPITDVAMNRNFMGGKINKEPYTTTEEGKYKRGKYAMKNTDEFWIDVADLLSGGDSRAMRDFEDGKGVSGSTLQHIFEGYVGQTGKFILDAGALPIKLHKGEDISVKDIPFANRVIVPYKQESAYNQEYWELYKGLKHYEDILNNKKKNDRNAYWEERGTQRYDEYRTLKRLVKDKPQEGDTHTPAEITKLMEANKKWREVRKPLEKTKEWRQVK